MHPKFLWLAAGLALAVTSTSLWNRSEPRPEPAPARTVTAAPDLPKGFGPLPAHFEPTGVDGEFVARRAGLSMTLDGHGARVHLVRGETTSSFGLMLDGAEPRAARPENRLPGISNYFLGEDPRGWRSGVPHYERVRYQDVYPGIDLVYYGKDGDLEYDFLVAPGADPDAIRMSYRGARDIHVDAAGDLRIALDGGTLVHRKPVSYQLLADGTRREVRSRFVIRDGAVTFALGDWDRARPLVIDPVLTFATYFGGAQDNEEIHALQVDATGAVYVAGQTNSPDLPVSGGAHQATMAGGFDVFVAKFNATGSTLLYATYLGGSSLDSTHLLRVDSLGNAYVAGETLSADFPISAGAPQATFGGTSDVFVAKLDATGSTLLYSTYLGGTGSEPTSGRLGGFEVDASGNAYVYGDTDSNDFPVTAGAAQPTRGNPNGAQFDQDAFLTRLNAAGTAWSYSTYHGGTGTEQVGDLIVEGHLFALDSAGNAWLAGTTESNDLPTTAGAFDTSFNGPLNGGDFFVARFDAGTGARQVSSYLGGTGSDLAEALVVDAAGNAYVAGRVTAGFPVTVGAADTSYGGGSSDTGVAKFDATGNTLAYATFLGGNSGEAVASLKVSGAGAAFVAGSTQSANFPATAGAADTSYNGGANDGYIARLNASGSAFTYATLAGSTDSDGVTLLEIDAAGGAYALLGDSTGTAVVGSGGQAHAGNWDDYFVKLNSTGSAFLDATYVGGSGDDVALAMAVDAQQNLYLGGYTSSSNYPTTPGSAFPAKPGASGDQDLFLAKFATTPEGPVAQPGTLALTAASFSVGESDGSVGITVSRNGGSSGAVSVSCATSTQGADSATPGSDYTATTVTLNWADGDAANKTCSVPVGADTVDEPDETFTVTLSAVTGGATLGAPSTATVTVVDDDLPPAPQPGTVQFNPAAYSVSENGGSVTLTLTRTLGADGAISVSVNSGGGSASAGADYTALSQTVSWANGDSGSKTVVLGLLDDTADEANETVTLTLANATGGATLGTTTATVTLLDDDLPPAPGVQNSEVKGKYGGGSSDGLMLGALALALLLAVVTRRRVPPAASVATTATAATAALAAALLAASPETSAAEGWYLGVRAGVAETTQQAADIDSALAALGHDVDVTLDDQETAATVFGGYRWDRGLALELGLSRIGEYTVEVVGTTTDPAALLADTREQLADAGRAVSLSLAWSLPLGDRAELTPRIGAYYWESTRAVRSAAGRSRVIDDGVDLTAGLQWSWKLDEQWSLGLGFEAWAARDRNDLRVWQIGVTRRLP